MCLRRFDLLSLPEYLNVTITSRDKVLKSLTAPATLCCISLTLTSCSHKCQQRWDNKTIIIVKMIVWTCIHELIKHCVKEGTKHICDQTCGKFDHWLKGTLVYWLNTLWKDVWQCITYVVWSQPKCSQLWHASFHYLPCVSCECIATELFMRNEYSQDFIAEIKAWRWS